MKRPLPTSTVRFTSILLALTTSLAVLTACSATQHKSADTGPPMMNGEQTVVFDPCNDVSGEALRATQVDPGSKQVSIDPPTDRPTTHRICFWRALDGPYFLNVIASVYSLEEIRQNPTLTGFRDIRIGQRQGLVYWMKSDENHLDCNIGMAAKYGSFGVTVSWFEDARAAIPQSPPCDLAMKHAQEIEPYLPKN